MTKEERTVRNALLYLALLALAGVVLLITHALAGDSRAMTILMGFLLMMGGISLYIWKSHTWPNWSGEEVGTNGK